MANIIRSIRNAFWRCEHQSTAIGIFVAGSVMEKAITMKLKTILTVALAIVCCGLSAQDRIHLVDSRRVIEAKIIEIGEVDIIYKLYNNLDGPDYRLSVSRIESIDFENGTRQVFTDRRHLATGPYANGYFDGYDDGCLDYRRGHYYMHDRRLRRQELTDYIGYSLYGEKYRKASSQYTWGMILTGIGAFGISITTMDLIFSNREKNDPNFQDDFFKKNSGPSNGTGYAVGYAASAACLGFGIPLWVKGNKKFNEIADDYNRNYGRRNLGYSSSVTIGPTSSGIGLALNF